MTMMIFIIIIMIHDNAAAADDFDANIWLGLVLLLSQDPK